MDTKKILTSWKFWAGITAVLVLLLIFKSNSIAGLLPFAVLLICPVMMIFMMRGHKHK